jgi:hypothetical protein
MDPGRFAVHPAVAPFGVLAGHRETRVLMFGRVAGPPVRAVPGPGGGLIVTVAPGRAQARRGGKPSQPVQHGPGKVGA